MSGVPLLFGSKNTGAKADAKTADAALEARLFHAIALCLAWNGFHGYHMIP
jgi:hypothetical protein